MYLWHQAGETFGHNVLDVADAHRRLTRWGKVNNKSITNIHRPVLIVGPEDLDQVSWLRFLIVLFQQMVTKKVYYRDLSSHLKTTATTKP